MRRAFATFLLPGLLVCSGCLIGAPPTEVVPSKSVEVARVAPPITPESVTEENYRTIPEALWAEMDREERELNAPAAPSEGSKKRS